MGTVTVSWANASPAKATKLASADRTIAPKNFISASFLWKTFSCLRA
jgi:hypothetical protein